MASNLEQTIRTLVADKNKDWKVTAVADDGTTVEINLNMRGACDVKYLGTDEYPVWQLMVSEVRPQKETNEDQKKNPG